MPMIKLETTVSLTAEKRDILKAELGKAISIIRTRQGTLRLKP